MVVSLFLARNASVGVREQELLPQVVPSVDDFFCARLARELDKESFRALPVLLQIRLGVWLMELLFYLS